ncbi:MAG TPA: electron transfer flavoprotein subunit beta/FixA family protein [Methanomicrobia archaeon]|nr:electron transfer flavoprotein subunit beta/FixA family protein [Methanomicrobia archaeon]HEX58687.1 electron transfer flavoprotein subunit beta/FixA family protein [Methanomicrobia archaeon]
MQFVVCVKQVPDPKHFHEISLDEETKRIRREGIPAVVNPLDENAVEEALRLRERYGGTIVAISMGPPQAISALRKALAMGVDSAILLSDEVFAGADALATAFTLAKGIKKLGDFDLVLCGAESVDGGTSQVPPTLAEFLGIPHAVFVREIEHLDVRKKELVVKRELEGGYMRVRLKMPAVISVTSEINTPRLPPAVRIMEAAKKEVKVWNAETLGIKRGEVGLQGSPTRVLEIFKPEVRRRRVVLKGDAEEVVRKAVELLKTWGVRV